MTMLEIWQDLKSALRTVKNSPGFAAIAILTLGLGMAVNTTIFSVVNGMILRPLPVPQPDQITVLTLEQGEKDSNTKSSYADFQDLQKQAAAFSELFAYDVTLTGLTADGHGDHLIVSRVSGNYFSALGIRPALGRLILPTEGQTIGSDPVVVISYQYWQRRFGGDPGVINKQVEINDHPGTIIGVTPKDFYGTNSVIEMDAFVPISAPFYVNDADANHTWTQRGYRVMTLMGRLKPGVSVGEANARMAVAARRLSEEYPATDKDVRLMVYPEKLARPDPDPEETVVKASLAFMGLAALVLLVACFNVANVLLVRATVRQREMAIRRALGAGRTELARKQLTETFLLAVLGGGAGMELARWACEFLSTLRLASFIKLHLDFRPDVRVYLFAFGTILLTSVIVGLIPALRVVKADVSMVLHEGGKGMSDGPGRHLARNTLVAAQVAGSLLLLVVAGLFTRSLGNAEHLNLGFNPDHVLNLSLSPDEVGYKDPEAREFYREVLAKVRALPGVISATEAFCVPMGPIGSSEQIVIEDSPLPPGEQPPTVAKNPVAPGYFDTMQIPLLEGRGFTDADSEKAPLVAVINHTMAKRYWPDGDPIGKKFQVKSDKDRIIEVVGIVGDGKYRDITEKPMPFFFVPLDQDFVSFQTLEVRTSVPPESLARSIENVIHAVGPNVPVSQIETMTEALNGGNGYFLYRFGAQVTGAMGLLGLILAVVGVYSVVSYAAAQRTREIGIRMALGAEPRNIFRMVLRQGLTITTFGIAAGLIASFGGTRVFSSMFLGVGAEDPLAYALGVGLLVVVALVACWVPARRATRVSPLTALRYE
jgi:predicted permease